MKTGIEVRGKQDQATSQVFDVLKRYIDGTPSAGIVIYRQNPASIRIRIVDENFKDLERVVRHDRVWRYLEQLPEEVQGDISMLVLLSPDELDSSFANIEFDSPTRSAR